MKQFGRISLIILLILNGLFFITNIYVLGNTQAAIDMHEDLAPSAGPFMANFKVINCFITGLLYVVAAYGLIRKRKQFILAGVYGAIFFFAFYIVELILWGTSHPTVWIGFSIFGTLSLVLGYFSFKYWHNL